MQTLQSSPPPQVADLEASFLKRLHISARMAAGLKNVVSDLQAPAARAPHGIAAFEALQAATGALRKRAAALAASHRQQDQVRRRPRGAAVCCSSAAPRCPAKAAFPHCRPLEPFWHPVSPLHPGPPYNYNLAITTLQMQPCNHTLAISKSQARRQLQEGAAEESRLLAGLKVFLAPDDGGRGARVCVCLCGGGCWPSLLPAHAHAPPCCINYLILPASTYSLCHASSHLLESQHALIVSP